ncbi:MAG: 4Fe-4S dicluster domain-containing protein [Candidatus Jordarchaeales archaeon]|nr:4Fe-4S dicluster domain-containing protein [Candidatus Jordarchaeia archaeon]
MVETYHEINTRFRKELAELHEEGETINFCYQCATCSGICPVFRYNSKYNPRRLIEGMLTGKKDELIHDPNIWLCTVCHNCTEVCPQGVRVSELLATLRNLATKAGNFPEHLRAEAKVLIETGLVNAPSKATISRRAKMGLPELKTADPAEIRALLEHLGFVKLTAKEEKAVKEESSGGKQQ